MRRARRDGYAVLRPRVLAPLRRRLGTLLSRVLAGGPVLSVTFPTTPLAFRVQIAPGAVLSDPPGSWPWANITGSVRYDPGISTSDGRSDESSQAQPSGCGLTLDNRSGDFSRRNPYGTWYGLLTKNTPLWIQVDAGSGFRDVYRGYVNEWPPRWDKSGNDSTVPIRASGILRRLSQGRRVKSAMRRTIAAAGPVAYWPLEDGANATAGAAAAGDVDLTANAVTFAAVVDLPGSVQAPDIGSGPGRFSAPVAGVSATSWYACWTAKHSAYTATAIGRIYTESATHHTFRLFAPTDSSNSLNIFITDSSDSTTTVLTGTVSGDFLDTWHHYAVGAEQSGANVISYLWIDGVLAAASTDAGTLSGPTRILFNHLGLTTFSSVAHVAIGDGVSPPGADAVDGYDGEKAHVRFARICAEEGILYTASGSTVDSPAMGPQPAADRLAILRECEEVDQGAMYEDGFGLGLQTRGERENAPVAFTVDFDLRQVAEPPLPADDDQRTRNVWTVYRSGGSDATVEEPSGPLGTDTVDPYDDETTVNVQSDDQLGDQAGWRTHLGTVDEERWPSIRLNLARSPELIDAFTGLSYGARVNVIHPPTQVAPDAIDAFIEGRRQYLTLHLWLVEMATSPASGYRVAVLAQDSGDTNDLLGWLDYDSCTLAVGVDTTATSWQISCSPAETSDPDDYPRQHWIGGGQGRTGGELITVTASTGGTTPTWTVTRSVNGVALTHSADAAITLAHPIILTL